MRIVEEQAFEIGQAFQVFQSGVGDLSFAGEFEVAKEQEFEIGQAFQVLQTSVGDLSVK